MDAAKKANVMFVDDERRVLSSMRALFRRDYNVHLANSGDEALALLEQQDMDVIVSDQRMPGMTGVDVLKACKQRAPRAMRILLTGYADKDAIAASINEGEVFRYLTKPCARETLKDTLAMAVSAAGIDPSTAATPAGAKPSPVPETTPRPAVTVSVAAPAPTPLRAPPIQADSAEPSIPSRVSTVSPLRSRIGQITSSFKPTTSPGVDLMVLSTDPEFIQGLESALGMSYRLHTVQGVAQAIEVLGANAIGVFITDLAVHLDEVSDLTAQLKHHVPELVTIVASDHSDAHRLIDLINGGQVFRFLLKPIKPTQTAIWIESAVSKHLELVSNPSLVARHAVAKPTSSLITLGDRFLRSLASRVLRLRSKTSAESQESSRP